ncbi:oligopeptide transporter [Pluteus cervinus]|uniref:Oligopeptide transporter n=1 Tax=Pluteus cervinus TaxID=181527 RepID=A0ACD3B0A5_9AGAR|nr:oligopeptide transporter [Pluteus cervinus]
MPSSIRVRTTDVTEEAESQSPSDKATIEKQEIKELNYVNEKLADVDDDSEVEMKDGEPIIRTGRDVSRFLVDIRDDGDQALTFRSMVLGTLFAGLGAALGQVYIFKPVQVTVSNVFLMLLLYTSGNLWAKFLPRRTWVEGTRLHFLGGIVDFINPGDFGLKEHVIATLLASTAAGTSTAVQNFAVQRLYYDTKVEATTAILATFSTACFGYGVVGLFRPLTVYPSEMVYWGNLPTVSVFQTLHFSAGENLKRLKFFWTAFTGMFIFEIFPSYIFPVLNGFSIFCLASQKASQRTIDIFTNIFGGADANQGLGFLEISFDWQYITATYMSLPLIQQANTWVGYAICYIVILAIYYSNTWNSMTFPMLSTSIFSSNGSIYHQSAVFGHTFELNQTALHEIGLPALTGSNAWANLTANLSIGGLVAHVVLFWGGYARDAFKFARNGTQPDPHYQAMKKYKEAPAWWYACLLVLAFVAGLVVVVKGQTTLPWWSYIIALLLGAFVAPFSTLLFARMGNGIATNQLMKMVAGAINPGRPFAMWSHDIVANTVNLSGDLKMGQYMKIPPRVMFLTQVWGSIVGSVVNYVVMISIVDAQHDVLMDPIGNNVWSGQYVQQLNSAAVTWSLAKYLYGFNGAYWIIPIGLVLGAIPTFIQWLIWKRWPKIGPLKVDSINLPVIYLYSSWMAFGMNSYVTSSIIVGLVSQLWLRRRHPGWYKKYNYVLGGALDGGAQVMIFILSFAVFGASGRSRPFPTWAGNPAKGNVDYCNGNGALD